MNSYDKTRFDVLSHLTDIPMLGKQYVPGLWKQFEDGHVTSRHEQSTEHRVGQESISQRNITETSPSTQRTRMNATLENERGLTRSTEKVDSEFLILVSQFDSLYSLHSITTLLLSPTGQECLKFAVKSRTLNPLYIY
ncbi:uncharacterized protein CELE_C24A8.5 [Caenorhabditis elegans]|uniref:Uncharacterized protein n=1 Tax=Caenorhabditis elegans TaxID=6239 RepID=P91097_CAEEL|nr:Uncharacterized protein CELE_C24A8.5 [Caenorhabditis elegans]CCD65394.1 Uncharacterized protein CELE_C24A8.5 [Caenorhabditis elegans]|eukprot:NP_508740.1 Uncharacterized protein CELE_C24A8.5 [Caenorhabditis elegans]